MSPATVAKLIGAQFPDIHPGAVTYLGQGYDSTAFDVNGTFVFRFPKRSDVEQQLLLEMRVLPTLANESPLPVPAFRFLGRPSADFPRHYGGYPKLAGKPAIDLDAEAIPAAWTLTLGAFLSWLHARPAAGAASLGVPFLDVSSLIADVRAEALEDLGAVHRVAPDAPLGEWRAYLEDPPGPWDSADVQVLLHGDLAAEHILFDPATRAITGVIDWSDMSIGDRSIDLAALFHWGGRSFADAVLSNYEGHVDTAALRRAQLLGACRGAGDVVFGLETGRGEYVHAGLRALTLCAGQADGRRWPPSRA